MLILSLPPPRPPLAAPYLRPPSAVASAQNDVGDDQPQAGPSTQEQPKHIGQMDVELSHPTIKDCACSSSSLGRGGPDEGGARTESSTTG